MCMCACSCGSVSRGCSRGALHPDFWRQGFPPNLELLVRLARLAPRLFSSWFLPSAVHTSVSQQDFYVSFRAPTPILVLARQEPYPLSHLPSPVPWFSAHDGGAFPHFCKSLLPQEMVRRVSHVGLDLLSRNHPSCDSSPDRADCASSTIHVGLVPDLP